jgi:DNA-directed RNA polymerase subunit RPC12/RpoP
VHPIPSPGFIPGLFLSSHPCGDKAMKRRKCSKCGKTIPYNSGPFTHDTVKDTYVCGACGDKR